MAFATHLIKVKGEFDKEKWSEEELKEYVDKKIEEIDSFFHPDLELFSVNMKENTIEVWVFIQTISETKDLKKHSKRWLKNHIKEREITVKNLEIEEILTCSDLLDETKPICLIHLP